MNSTTYLIRTLAVFAVLLLMCVITPLDANQHEARGGISGKVVDLEGKAIANFRFAVQFVVQEGGRFLHPSSFPGSSLTVEADSTGAFSISDLHPGLVQLSPLPDQKEQSPNTLFGAFRGFLDGGRDPHHRESETGKKIHALQVGNVTLFNISEHRFGEGLTLVIEPGVILENITVIVKSRLRIRAQVVYPDGKPLANAKVDLDLEQRHETRRNHSSSSGLDVFTDAEGYFTHHVDEPGFYTVSVRHNVLSAGMGPFLLKDGVHLDERVLTLAGKVAEPEPPGAADTIPPAGEVRFQRPPPPPSVEGVWIINPTNGHAYKKIQCQDWHDAQRQAAEAGAHLVSINDEVEQQWLGVIFRQKPFWIGLNDLEAEGEWRWDSGEPVTYTNWAVDPVFNDKLPDAEKDYVVLTFRGNGWQSVAPNSHFWRMARFAVIEKDGLVSTINR